MAVIVPFASYSLFLFCTTWTLHPSTNAISEDDSFLRSKSFSIICLSLIGIGIPTGIVKRGHNINMDVKVSIIKRRCRSLTYDWRVLGVWMCRRRVPDLRLQSWGRVVV
jgi:hypothetical protein